MRAGSWSLPQTTAVTGSVALSAVVLLVWTRAPLGSPLFFTLAAVIGGAYLALLRRTWGTTGGDRRPLMLALAFAVLFRLPLALAPVGPDSDMERYLWDGRVQTLGYNPYSVIPADPAMAATHTADSTRMPSRRVRTPYPPAAQLFFRLVVTLHDSLLAMKLAMLAADLLTIVVLLRWLAATRRSAWLAIAYAWNPLVILEVAHSGHVDALGAMWLVLAAWCLTTRRTLLAMLAFVLAVTTKLLPVVLAPLFVGRVRWRDAAIGALVVAGLYYHFHDASAPALGAVPNVVDYIRFNGPVFRALAGLGSPRLAAAVAVFAGLAAAVIARLRLPADDPAAWSWPMALSLAAAPVVYPWYLLYLTPFLWTRRTLPLLAWSMSAPVAYVVWEMSRRGGRWIVPGAVQAFELAVPIAVALLLWRRSRLERAPAELSAQS
jgi:alpha-1,6-mannosyltransferase